MREMRPNKLDKDDVELIRELRSYGIPRYKIAEVFDVAKSTIQRWTSEEYRKREKLRSKGLVRRKGIPKWKRLFRKLAEILYLLAD